MMHAQNINNEKGFVLILLPFVLITMLAGLGLMIDSTNLYAAKVQAGAAAEQGILSAIGSYISETDPVVRATFSNDTSEKEYLVKRFATTASNNLTMNSIKSSDQLANNEGKFVTNFIKADLSKYDSGPDSGVFFNKIGLSNNMRVTGHVRLTVPVFFKSIYDLIGRNQGSAANIVDGYATAELKGSAFIFAIDISSSQACPSYGPCLCKTNLKDTVGSCRDEANARKNDTSVPVNERGEGNIRVEDIKSATIKVLEGLDRRRDRFAILIYNNSAQILHPFIDPSNSDTPGIPTSAQINKIFDDAKKSLERLAAEDKVASVVDPITPNGNTNISDALITARSEFDRAAFLSTADTNEYRGRLNVILLSDGAPTAMRVQPDSTLVNQATGGLDPDKLPVADGDYLEFQIANYDDTNKKSYPQPGPFIKTLEYKNLVSVKNPARPKVSPMVPESAQKDGTGYEDKKMLPACHLVTGDIVDPKIFSFDATDKIQAFKSCLNNDNWKLKGDTKGFASQNFTLSNSIPTDSTTNLDFDFRQMYYLAAVRAVDFLADSKVRLFTLSWGPKEPEDKTKKIFEFKSVSNVKSEVLANLANDPFSSKYNQDQNNQSNQPYDKWSQDPKANDLFGGKNYGFQGRKQRGLPLGGSYVAINKAGLDRLFSQIIVQAKLAVVDVLPPHTGSGTSSAPPSGGGEGEGEGEGEGWGEVDYDYGHNHNGGGKGGYGRK